MGPVTNLWKRGVIIAAIVITPITLFIVLITAMAAPGELDPSFDGDGIVTTKLPNSTDSSSTDVAIQSDGKIIAAGYSTENRRFFAMTRYNMDGSLDTSFDTDGIVTTTMDASISTTARSVVLQPDGKIILAGDGGLFNLARYDIDGGLDTTFDDDGRAQADFTRWAGAFSVDIQQDGKIVAAGSEGHGAGMNAAAARFNVTGTLDTEFDGDGLLVVNVNPGDDQIEKVIVQKNNKILLVGWTDNGADLDILLIRLQRNGDLDPSFGTTGIVTTSIGFGSDFAQSAVVQPDNKIVVGGSTNTGSDLDFALLRYNNNGTLDDTFGAGGVVTTSVSAGIDKIFDLALLPSGKIVAVGGSDGGANDEVTVARYNPDGSLDQSFGNGGIITTAVGDGDSGASGVDLQTDGKIVASGFSYDSSTSVFTVLRYDGNEQPIADAGLDQTVTGADLVTLNGSGSYDPNNNVPLDYKWDQTGGTSVALSDSQFVSPTFTAPVGSHVLTFTLIVSDSLGLTSLPDQVVITVTVNEQPIADAGIGQTVDSGDPVTLDGSGSYDPNDNLPLTYKWDQTGGTSVALSDSQVVSPTFTAPVGSHVLTFTLIVSDSLGLASLPDQVAVTVTEVVNEQPIADAGTDQTVDSGDPVTLDGSGSYDPDGDLPLTYKWDQAGGTPIALSDSQVVSPTFTAPGGSDVLTFTLIVSDSLGLPSLPDQVTITVTEIVNQQPIADAGTAQTVDSGDPVILDGSGSSDPDGDLPLTYKWDQTGGAPVALSDSQVVSPTFTAPVGSHVLTFTLIVSDSLGLASLPDKVAVTVLGDVVNERPIADAGPAQTVDSGDPVTLDGSGSSDPDGDLPLAYKWDQTGGTPVALSDSQVVSPNFTAPVGSHELTFSLIVSDSLGLVSLPDEVTVTVIADAANEQPIADAGPDQNVSSGDLVGLDGSGSSDPDGNLPLSYSWVQSGGAPVTLSDNQAVSPSFTAPYGESVLTFTLTVSDSLGLSSTPDLVTINVERLKNYLPTIIKTP